MPSTWLLWILIFFRDNILSIHLCFVTISRCGSLCDQVRGYSHVLRRFFIEFLQTKLTFFYQLLSIRFHFGHGNVTTNMANFSRILTPVDNSLWVLYIFTKKNLRELYNLEIPPVACYVITSQLFGYLDNKKFVTFPYILRQSCIPYLKSHDFLKKFQLRMVGPKLVL